MMNEIGKSIFYFPESGPQNTDMTLRLAKKRAENLDIKNVVVASTTGSTGLKASEIFKNYNLVVVSHVAGFRKPNAQSFIEECYEKIIQNGGKIVTAAHAFGGLGRAIHRSFGAIQVDEIIANTLRILGQGVKVACEVTCMAADAGLVKVDEEAVGIGGSGGGADTALVLKPANTHTFFTIKIKELICKPRL
jgi:hypothetical protein